MISSRALLSCLPLLASSLGQRYGVRVAIGGNRAYTDGTIIRLPGLPADADPRFIGLVRGYIDHEAAHIRFTDFDLLRREPLGTVEKHIWNIFEDWRIEDRLAKLYPGCGENFQGLIQQIFLDAPRPKLPKNQWVLDWLLLTVRSWRLPALSGRVRRRAAEVESVLPGLLPRLQPILDTMRQHCPDSAACLHYARQILACLQTAPAEDPAAAIEQLLAVPEMDLPEDVAAILQRCLRQTFSKQEARATVAIRGDKKIAALTSEQLQQSRRLTSGLKARLMGLLQSTKLKRVAPARRGKLDPKLLHGVATGSAKLFRRVEPKPGLNTAVHLLLDTSGSMRERISLACHTTQAIAESLHGLGIPLAVTSFPGICRTGEPTIVPMLDYDERPHDRFLVEASGDTPLAEALWAVLLALAPRPEPRQIILLLTDGEPDDLDRAQDVIRTAQRLGIEIYALGIKAPGVTTLLPTTSQNIETLNALPEALFGLLQRALLRKG